MWQLIPKHLGKLTHAIMAAVDTTTSQEYDIYRIVVGKVVLNTVPTLDSRR
jgi:hypothetical protein